MKAQDLPLNNRGLRLGNKVLIDGKICTVDHLYGQYIRTKEMPSIIDAYRDAYGIELTPEVLKLCEETMYDKLINEKGDMVADMIGAGEIKYLHQLMNLYYSLTGEELTISLPTVKLEQ